MSLASALPVWLHADNPLSETQLRSRLKKWRVTKPSRQIRKKPQGSDDADSEKEVKAPPTNSSRTQKPSSAAKETSVSRPEWPAAPTYAPHDGQPYAVDGKWNAPLVQQLTPSPSGEHILGSERPHSVQTFGPSPATSSSFDQSAQSSPVAETLMINTTSALTPTYSGYPLSPESCLPSPGSTTTPSMGPWPSRSVSVDMSFNPAMHSGHWYPMSFEPITPPSVPQPAPDCREQIPMAAPAVYPHEYAHYEEASDFRGYDPKSWKRSMSLQHDIAGHHRRSEQAYRKHIPPHGQPSPGVIPLPSTQLAGPHAVMCAPIVPCMGLDPIAQKPSGVGY